MSETQHTEQAQMQAANSDCLSLLVRPVRIQLSRRKGWRIPPGAVRVDRCTQWGNPHRVGLCPVCGANHTAEEAVAEYRAWLTDPFGGSAIAERATRLLRGKDLACWCRPGAPCHADVLLELANTEDLTRCVSRVV